MRVGAAQRACSIDWAFGTQQESMWTDRRYIHRPDQELEWNSRRSPRKIIIALASGTHMVASSDKYDVAIVGAGVIGCAAARELAPDHDVIVIDRDNVASGTTGRASGLVTTAASYASHPSMAKYTISFFRDYDGTGDFEFTTRPRLLLTSPDMEAQSRETARESAQNGFQTTYLTAEEVENRYEGIFNLDEYAGVVEYQDTGWVDPYTFTITLQRDAEDSGAEFVTGVEVTDVLSDGDGVSGVRTDNGDVSADWVVCANNWHMRELLQGILEVPVVPFRWQDIQLDPGFELDEDFPMCYDPVSQLYWRPEHNGNLVVGGGEYRVETPGEIRESITESFRMRAATEVPKKLTNFEEAELVSGDTCLRGDSTTPDRYPIMDEPNEAPEGLIVNTGYHIGGIMTAPAAGIGTRALITGKSCPFSLEPFRFDRFETTDTEFEFVPLMAAHTSFD